MNRVLLIAAFLLVAPLAARAQVSPDAYGGDTSQPCPNPAITRFNFQLHGLQWWLCTPSGNRLYLQAVGAWTVSSVPFGKYGTGACDPYTALVTEFKSWHINAAGELGDNNFFPVGACSSSFKLPFVQTLSYSQYATANLNNLISQPVKDMKYGWNGYRQNLLFAGHGVTDIFDANYESFLQQLMAADTFGIIAYKNSPYFVGLFMDDTDFFWGLGAGDEYDTTPAGHNNDHMGYMTLITAPQQTFNPANPYNQQPELYPLVTKLYSKAAMTSPPVTCTIATPCALRDFLFKRYSGSISALDAAWGSNYTTFDSSGTQVTAEVCGTGNGVQTVFTCTLAHPLVTPESVLVKVGGTAQGGDCPWFQACNVSGISLPYTTCATPGNCQGSLQGVSTSIIASGAQPFLTDNPCTGSGTGLPAASFWAQVVYHGVLSAPSRMTGNTCPAGQTSNVNGPDGTSTGAANPPGATGYDVYMSCRGLSGGATAGCAAAGPNTAPPLVLQSANIPICAVSNINVSSNVATISTGACLHGLTNGQLIMFSQTGLVDINDRTDSSTHLPVFAVSSTPTTTSFTFAYTHANVSVGSGGTTWGSFLVPNSGLVSGAALPGPPSVIDYGNGHVTITTSTPVANGASITLDYVSNGWMFGTGLMDEDGRNSWLGTNGTSLLAYNGLGPGNPGYASRPGNPAGLGPINANQTLAADLDAWESQFVGEYMSSMRTAIKANAPNMSYCGPDTFGTWFAPPRKSAMLGAASFLDCMFVNWSPSVTNGLSMLAFTTQYVGDIPFLNFSTITACQDSDVAGVQDSTCGGVFHQVTQTARAQEYYNQISGELSAVGANSGHLPFIGHVHWASHDNVDSPPNNWGLKTRTDNAFDAREAAAAPTVVPCSAPLTSSNCGKEPPPGGAAVPPFSDFIGPLHGVMTADVLWLTGVPPTTFTLSLGSANPGTGVTITYSPADNNGHSSCVTGSTCAGLPFNANTSVVSTAPATAGTNPFGSWSGCDTVVSRACTTLMNANKAPTATYVTPLATLTIASTPSAVPVTYSPADTLGNTSCTTSCAPQFPVGTVVQIVAPATVGVSVFSSWGGCDSVTLRTCTRTMNSSVSVNAAYVVPTFTVSIAATNPTTATVSPADAGGNTSCSTPCTLVYPGGTTVVTTVPTQNFTSYTGCPSAASNVCTLPALSSNKSITANYASSPPPTFTLSVSSQRVHTVTIAVTPTDNGGHSSVATPGSLMYPSSTSVHATAPSTVGGKAFSSWTGCDSVVGTVCTVVMSSNRSITAVYASSSGGPHSPPGRIPVVTLLSGGN